MRVASQTRKNPDAELALLAAERALHVDGDPRAARQWSEAAHRAAERQGDALALARASLSMSGLWVHEHHGAANDTGIRARQRHALTLVDPLSTLAVRLRARLVAEEDHRFGEHTTILRVLAQARLTDDPVTIAETLSLAHQCLMSPEHEAFRADLAQDLVGQSIRTHRRGDLLVGLMWRSVDLFLAGDPRAERSLRELCDELARQEHVAVGLVADAIEVMLTIRAGHLAEAEALADACARRAADTGDDDAQGRYGTQLTTIRWYQGRMAELVDPLSELIHHAASAHVPALAVAAANAGDRRLASGMLARLSGHGLGLGLGELPRTRSWLAMMHGVAEAAHLLDDADTAAQVYRLLTPFAGLPAMAGPAVACFGSTHHALGMAALTTGDLDGAADHLGWAVRSNLGLGHWPAASLSRWRLGLVLAMRHGSSDPAARRHLALAEQEAAELGMALPAGPAGRVTSRGGEVAAATCRRHGRQWQIELGGRIARVDNSVGLRHLAILLANPGQEILAADLAAGQSVMRDNGAALSVQPVLDQQAERTYRDRLRELEAEIAELESLNDSERAAALGPERDWLAAELAASTGLGGRARPFATDDERARVAVGKAIRRALTRIAEADGVIGGELRATVETGRRCCYRPR